MSSGKATGLMLAVSFIWGSGYVITQFALDANWRTFQLLAGRFLLGAIVLSIIFFKKFISIKKEDIIAGSITGFFLFSGFGFQTVGQIYSTPAITAFVTTACVIMVPFLDWGIYKKKPDIYVGIGAALTFAGVACISLTDSVELSYGVLLVLVSTVFYAMQVCSLSHFTKKLDPIRVAIVMVYFSAIAGIVTAGFDMVFINNALPDFTAKGIGSVIFLGIVSTALCFLGQSVGQKYTSATKAAIILSTECVFGAFTSVIVYKEVLSLQTIIGCCIVFIAVITAETKWKFLKIHREGTLDGGNH